MTFSDWQADMQKLVGLFKDPGKEAVLERWRTEITGTPQERLTVAGAILQFRGHTLDVTTTAIRSRDMFAVGQCTRCQMQLKVKMLEGEVGVGGRVVELNCPAR